MECLSPSSYFVKFCSSVIWLTGRFSWKSKHAKLELLPTWLIPVYGILQNAQNILFNYVFSKEDMNSTHAPLGEHRDRHKCEIKSIVPLILLMNYWNRLWTKSFFCPWSVPTQSLCLSALGIWNVTAILCFNYGGIHLSQ